MSHGDPISQTQTWTNQPPYPAVGKLGTIKLKLPNGKNIQIASWSTLFYLYGIEVVVDKNLEESDKIAALEKEVDRLRRENAKLVGKLSSEERRKHLTKQTVITGTTRRIIMGG